MLMDDVFEARMAFGETVAASSENIACFKAKFSDTAYERVMEC